MAGSRIAASVLLAVVAAAAAFSALVVRVDLGHPLHAAVAVFAFALLYLAVGVLVVSLITVPLEGIADSRVRLPARRVRRPGHEREVRPAVGREPEGRRPVDRRRRGHGSPTGDWVKAALVTLGGCWPPFGVFVASARSRS